MKKEVKMKHDRKKRTDSRVIDFFFRVRFACISGAARIFRFPNFPVHNAFITLTWRQATLVAPVTATPHRPRCDLLFFIWFILIFIVGDGDIVTICECEFALNSASGSIRVSVSHMQTQMANQQRRISSIIIENEMFQFSCDHVSWHESPSSNVES